MKSFAPLLLAIAVLSGCSTFESLEAVERGQHEHARLLQQQAIRLAMHEEYLSQLAEYQLEMERSLQTIAQQTRDIDTALTRLDTTKGPAEEAAARPEPERVVTTEAPSKMVIGRNEWVWLELLGRNLKARVDTGALTSSLNAVDIQPFERDGRDWVRFRVPDEEHPEGGDVYEAPLIRHVRIRQAAAEGLDRRPVVRLQVRMGDYVDVAEFNLTNRENMLYPLLLGRNFLRDIMLVDVARKFTRKKYKPGKPVANR
ncbi:ATP-dependent zinc protease family protein [Gilvimarinus sp. F26214L]|uniref:ATP-dependent zinc protease family protein n=1 Tax=Gilvimarinus sp. DZF01 TaxID=3461371 RepID=UPI004045AE86